MGLQTHYSINEEEMAEMNGTPKSNRKNKTIKK